MGLCFLPALCMEHDEDTLVTGLKMYFWLSVMHEMQPNNKPLAHNDGPEQENYA